jgi:hypothetical protein
MQSFPPFKAESFCVRGKMFVLRILMEKDTPAACDLIWPLAMCAPPIKSGCGFRKVGVAPREWVWPNSPINLPLVFFEELHVIDPIPIPSHIANPFPTVPHPQIYSRIAMVVARVRMNCIDAQGYTQCFRAILKLLLKIIPLLRLENLWWELAIADWSDQQAKGLEMAVGKSLSIIFSTVHACDFSSISFDQSNELPRNLVTTEEEMPLMPLVRKLWKLTQLRWGAERRAAFKWCCPNAKWWKHHWMESITECSLNQKCEW